MSKLKFLQWPFLLWMSFFILFPSLYVIFLSFAVRGTYGGIVWSLGLQGYLRSLDPIFLQLLSRSLTLGALTTLICLVLGVSLSWYLASQSRQRRIQLFAWICIPFFINLVSRIYALRSVLGHDGPVAQFAGLLGFSEIDLFSISQNQYLVVYGMVATYLPYMLFPVFVSMESFDFSQVEAVYDLGGSAWLSLRKIILPQIAPALLAGSMMVFVPACGEYVIPDLLGGARVMLVGNLITDQFLRSRDWPFGAVIAVQLMVVLGMILVLLRKVLVRRLEIQGG